MKAIKQAYKWIKRLLAAWLILLGITVLLILLILEVPAVQQLAARKAVDYIQNEFSISLELQSINIDFPDAILLEGIYLTDEQSDTLLYCQRLHADIALLKFLDNSVDIEELLVNELVLNISRKGGKQDFNYQFLLDAFASDTTSQIQDTTTGTAWELSAELIQLSNIALTYEDDSTGLKQQLSWANFSANLQTIDLENNEISIDEISIKDAISKTELLARENNPEEESNADSSSEISLQTGWDIAVEKLQLDNNQIIYANKNYPDTINGFDANHLNISDFNLQIDDIVFNDNLLKAAIEQFTFREKSGLVLNNFETTLLLKEQGGAALKNFRINTPYSQAALDLSFNYPSLNDFVNLTQQTSLALNLYELNPGYKDLALFVPAESIADYANIIDSLKIEGNLKGSPTGELLLERLNVSINQETQLTLHGQLKEVMNLARLDFSIQLDSFVTTKTALNSLVPELIPAQLNLPQNLTTKGLFEGDLQNVDAAVFIESNYGDIAITSRWQTDSIETNSLSGSIDLKQYALGELLPDYELGNTATSLNYKVSILADGNITANAKLNIDSLEYSNKNFEEIVFDAFYQEEALSLQGTSNNEILDFDLNLNSELKEQQIHELILRLNKVNLVQLGLSDSISSVSADIQLKAELSDINDLTAELKIDTAQFIRANTLTKLNNLGFVLYQEKDSLFFKSDNELLDAQIYSNLNLGEIAPEVLGYFDSYLDMGEMASDRINNDYLSIRLQTYESPVWQELIVPGLAHISPTTLSLFYEQASEQMQIGLQTDSIAYNGVIINDLNFALSGDNDAFNMQFGSGEVSAGPLALYEPAIGIIIDNDTAYTNILVKDSIGQASFVLSTQLNKKDSSFYLHINADTLLLSGDAWQVSPDNYLLIQKNNITVNNFLLRNKEQALSVNSIEDRRDSLLVSFEKFKVGNFLGAIGFTEKELSGKLEGDILLSQVFTNFQFGTDLSIDSIHLYEVPVGNLQVQAENTTSEKYTFDLALKGMKNDMEMKGNMLLEEDTKLDITADINAIDLEVLEGLSGGALQNVEGYIAGDLSVNGIVTAPIITGDVRFVNTSFLVSYLNTSFQLDEQRIEFEPSSIIFDNLLIKDSDNNEARVNGKIIKNSLIDYDLDLKLKANNFKALDTKQGDNELYYGKVKVNSEIDVIGDLLTPTIDMSVELLEGSDVTYIVPEDELLVEDQKGIIEFVQITAEDTLIMNKDTLVDNTLTGFDLNMNIEINEDTKFTVLIDEDAGDKLEVEGEGDLVFGLQRNGNMTLTGRYIINDGYYLLTFYGLVKKQFALADGSSVVWRGDPYNAALSIQTIYETRTSPQTLMANAGNDASQYTRPEKFQVLMNIRGELAKPQISFELDIPQAERSNASIYNTVRLLNQNEAELNKQVFALLVLNSFMATNSSNQNIGDEFISSTARSSVSQLLTQQLNNLSEKFIKGVQLDLNLESYGSGSQAGTDLQVGISKSLLDDRITLEVGGSYQLEGEEQAGNNNLIGNVAIEYKITEDGRYRLRFFQMNDTNILDGQVTSTGLSIIFTRDYDKLKHLFKKKTDETQ